MADAKVRAIPWMQKIESYNGHHNGDFLGWHNGQTLLYNSSEKKNFGSTSSGHKLENIEWWADDTSLAGNWTTSNLFGSNGVASELRNGKKHNTCFFIGTQTTTSSFYNNIYTYPMSSKSSMVRNAIGFSCQNTCRGSYSDGGGNAQAWLEKVGLFYAHPDTGKRHIYMANNKVSGNHNLNLKYPNNNDYYYCYRLSSSNITTVKDQKLVLMGMGFQFVHDYKSAPHTSMCSLKNLRIIAGDGTGLVSTANRLLICGSNLTTFQEFKDNSPRAIAYT